MANSHASNEKMSDIDDNIARVNELFLLDPETLPDTEVLQLSQDIVKNRTLYNNNTIAKMFSLLADSAINKGDLSRAMQFSLDGESLNDVEDALKLSLMLKITSGYYFKGKFKQAQKTAEQSVSLAVQLNDPKLLIKALSYRAMTNALNLNHQQAFLDLKQVEQLLADNQQFSDHISLINVLASAHYYIADYQTSITLYNRVLKLRYDLAKKNNIERTYYDLARSYLSLGRFDDAYHGFWKAIKHAEEKNAPINIAYAKMGLGQVLLKQNKVELSLNEFETAKTLLYGKNLTHPYLTTLIGLAKVTLLLARKDDAFQYLLEAEKLALRVELTSEQIELYSLLSTMYQEKGSINNALLNQIKYTQLYKKFSRSHQKSLVAQDIDVMASERQRDLSLGMTEEIDLKNKFSQKYQRQKNTIIGLTLVVVLMTLLALIQWFRARALRLNQQYEEIEKPTDHIASPSQTKKFYQHHFKMARKYEYPLLVGYFSIDNWQELEFQFSKKVVGEVSRTISTLVNRFSGEFDQVGLINHGEYLFLCPHQTPDYIKQVFEQLTNALKVQFFANLGEFSIKISYDYQSPNIQDIDPYIFLSRLSESTRAEYSSYKT